MEKINLSLFKGSPKEYWREDPHIFARTLRNDDHLINGSIITFKDHPKLFNGRYYVAA